jgi:outer membrane usher protein
MQVRQALKRRWNLPDRVYSRLLAAFASIVFSHAVWAGPINTTESLLAIEINQLKVSDGAMVLKEPDGSLWLRAQDMSSWRIRLPPAGGETFDGQTYFRIGDLAGVSFTLDEIRQTLKMAVLPESLMAAAPLSLARPLPVLSPSGTGGFLNYDLFGQVSPDSSGEGALFELGLFNGWGVGLNTVAFEEGRAGGRGIRLETAWVRDWPEKLSTLRLGDSLSRTASLFGGITRFAGVQYGTNFATQPQLITTPLQSIAGETGLPSVAEIYVNNNLIQRHDIPAGGFNITDIPAISGSGEVTVVVKDILGREQVITQPFYSSPVLLAEGLSDFSFEAGVERENFATRSADYGRVLASATWRKGLTDHLTAEAHGEWTKDHLNLGLGGVWLMPRYGVLGLGVAGSSADNGGGSQETLTYEYSQHGFSAGVRQQWASRDYRQLGQEASDPLPASQTSVFGGMPLGKAGNLALAWFRQDKRSEADSEFVTLSYQVSLPMRGTLLLNYLQTLTGEKAKAATLSLTFPFGERSTASYQHRNDLKRSGDADVHYLTLQQSLPAGEGWGYRLQLSDREENDLGVAYQGRYGTYSADVLQRSDGTTTNLVARGGVGWLSGKLFASRAIDDSFAMVNVSGFPDVRVYAENQLMGKTGQDGKLLLPQLRAYEENDIRIDHRDLPMDTKIETLRLKIAPYFRSGAHVEFPVRRLRPALMTLVREDGTPIPADARVTKAGETAYYSVGMDGLVYVDNMDDETLLVADYTGRQCRAHVVMPVAAGPQPDLGRQVCRETGP